MNCFLEYFWVKIRENPNSYLTYFHLGLQYHYLGKELEAAYCFRKTLEINPQHEEAI